MCFIVLALPIFVTYWIIAHVTTTSDEKRMADWISMEALFEGDVTASAKRLKSAGVWRSKPGSMFVEKWGIWFSGSNYTRECCTVHWSAFFKVLDMAYKGMA